MKIPENGFYYHYKHDPHGSFNDYSYEVIGIARNTEEKTYSVLYRPLYENDWFVPATYQARPLDMFNENVEKDGKTMPRFELITNPEIVSKLTEVKKKMYDKD